MTDTKHTPERCAEYVDSGWKATRCSRTGSVERNGNWYCAQHDPVRVEEKRKARLAKVNAEWEAQKAAIRRRKAEEAACAGIPTEALEAGVVAEMREALKGYANCNPSPEIARYVLAKMETKP